MFGIQCSVGLKMMEKRVGASEICIAGPDVAPIFSSMHKKSKIFVMLLQGVELARGNMVSATQTKLNGPAACQIGKRHMGNKSSNV